jgi:hypothetical protein
MKYWSISIPIEGPVPDNLPAVSYSKVLFHIYDDPDLGKKQLFGSIILEGQEMSTVGDMARMLVDDALSKLHLVHGHPLFPRIDDIRLVEHDEGIIPDALEVGRKRVSASLTTWYRIGEDKSRMLLFQMEHIKSEKKIILDRAAAYYRLGVCSINPYQAIESFFSSVSSIVRDDINGRDPTKHHLRDALYKEVGKTVPDFQEKFDRYYDKRRSAATHGGINPLLLSRVTEARKDSIDLKSWVNKMIVSFIENNQTNSFTLSH